MNAKEKTFQCTVKMTFFFLGQLHSDLKSRVAAFLDLLAALISFLHSSFHHWWHWSSHFCENGWQNLKIFTFAALIFLCAWIGLCISVRRAGTILRT
jgi:hypothetical protein